MAQVLPFNGFYTGNSEKNSSRTCVNYMPIKHDSGALSEYTLESTTGIGATISSSLGNHLGKAFKWSIDDEGEMALITAAEPAAEFNLIKTNGVTFDTLVLPGAFGFFPHSSVSVALSGVASIVVNTTSTSASDIHAVKSDFTVYKSGGLVDLRIADSAALGDRFIYMSASNSVLGKKRVYYSDISEPTEIDPLGFFSDTAQATDSTGVHVLNDRLYLFSRDGYSVWNNTPDVNLPFIKQKGSSGSIGLVGPSSKTEVGGVLYFIGLSDGKASLYSMAGGGASYLGNEYIDHALRFADERNLFSFKDADRTFICIGSRYCYDTSSGEWHTRLNEASGVLLQRWGVVDSVSIFNEDIMFGVDAGLFGDELLISTADSTIGTEFGHVIEREVITSPFNSDGVANNVRELAFQTDIDYSSLAPVTLPDLSLSVSENFGRTFGAERLEAFDADGENTKILRYMNIGFFRQAFVFKLKTNNIYPHKILKMLARLEKGFRQI